AVVGVPPANERAAALFGNRFKQLWRSRNCRLHRIKECKESASTRLTGDGSVVSGRLFCESVIAVYAAIRPADQATPLAIDGEVIEVEEISATGAGGALQ